MLLDEQYLQDIGVMDLPGETRQEVIADLEDNIQDAVSLRVADELSDDLMQEFDVLNDGTIEEVKAWLTKVMPFYATSPEFLQQMENRSSSEDDFTREYAVIKWMTMNVPNYSDIVREIMDNTKTELLAIKQKIAEEA